MIKVLDHGYVKFVESWGGDEAIIEAARMSTGKGFLGWEPSTCPTCGGGGFVPTEPLGTPQVTKECTTCEGKGKLRGDKHLLRFLHEHKHATPFEFAGMVIEVKAPIFVFREWHRHRTQSYNEMSSRYTPLPDENYIPTVERLMINSKKNKQAGTVKGAKELDRAAALWFRSKLKEEYKCQEDLYQDALETGVPKELARVVLPVGRYSRMRAHANLRNWLGFLTLRMDKAAQYEIRQYANAVGQLIEQEFPRTWELFESGR